MNLNFIEKVKIFFYFLFNKIDTAYILTPKNFYYFLPLIFRNTKFYAITINGLKKRPQNFLKKYLYKYAEIDRLIIKKRKSSYDIQENLIDTDLIKNQMLQYGQAIPDEKEVDGIVARVMSNKDEIKRLTEQLTSTRILNFFKDNFNYKTKKVDYDEYIKEAYPS